MRAPLFYHVCLLCVCLGVPIIFMIAQLFHNAIIANHVIYS